MRISVWSSDVCSSDLHGFPAAHIPALKLRHILRRRHQWEMRPDEGHIEEEGFALFARLANEFRLPVDKHVRRIPIALPDARRIGGHTLAVDIDRLREPLRLVGIIAFARRRGERAVARSEEHTSELPVTNAQLVCR